MIPNRPFSLLIRPALLVLAVVAATTAIGSAPTGAATTAPTPSVTSGPRTLRVSQSENLDPNGQSIIISGSGYDTNRGIYVAYCLEPRPGEAPSPCGGGEDRDGSTGSSFWISSNPPSYGEGLAIPYGPGGSFNQTIHVSPMIGNIDCRRVQCVVVSRNDHVRSTDRSQDVLLPINFAQPSSEPQAEPGAPDPPPETTTTTTLPQPPPDEERPAPEAELSEDRRSVTAGEMRLAADTTTDLDPEGEVAIVTGAGFDEERGVRLAFCEIADGEPTERCLEPKNAVEVDDDEAVTALDVSSNPSDEQRQSSQPFGPSGSFGTKLIVQAQIGKKTDCTETTCAIVTLPHPDRPLDRGQNLVLPVTFEVEEPPETTTTTEAPSTATSIVDAEPEEQSSGGGSGIVIAIIAAFVLAGGAGGAVWYRRNRAEIETP